MERCYMSNLFSVPNLFFYLGLLPDFHLVILFTLCLCINFSCHSRKTLKGFLKSLLAFKKKTKPIIFIPVALKKW